MTYQPRSLVEFTPTGRMGAHTSNFAMHALVQSGGFSSSVTWPSANKPVAVPFWLPEAVTCYRVGWLCGSGTMTDNIDVGIYDSSWARLVSTGSTALGTANTYTEVDIADTTIGPGKFYLVTAMNGTTANQIARWANASGTAVQLGAFGMMDSGTNAFALPNPLTNMVSAATFTFLPLVYISTVST